MAAADAGRTPGTNAFAFRFTEVYPFAMAAKMATPKPQDAQTGYPARKARGAVIILKRPWQRIVFFGGLAGCVLLVFVAALLL